MTDRITDRAARHDHTASIARNIARELSHAADWIDAGEEMAAECHEIAAREALYTLADAMGFSLVKTPDLMPLDKAASVPQNSYLWEKARGD